MPTHTDSNGKSMGQVAYGKLHEAIETGVLKPGDRISVNGLADTLQISRTPVREAIAWLETDGLIVHEPYRGRVVAQLDQQMVIELYAIRLVLETSAAALAAQNASEAEVDVLREMLVLEREVLGDPMRRERLNRRFHDAIYRSAHNRYLLTTLRALQTPMILLGPATASEPARAESASAEHQRLVDAIARRDAEGAREAMRVHLAGGQRARINAMLSRERD
ncbi:MAG: GntR family transcriptional regulator [Hydrogenophaga sp.]|jgi:DNA-binding GntR family transcriptional regulator|uniref:GntR family transcriptional regulator n=1 Tax=Hydrogenophaga sp. TaxID=1904254 RepID=UPI004036FEC5